jgi:hypothetical protein
VVGRRDLPDTLRFLFLRIAARSESKPGPVSPGLQGYLNRAIADRTLQREQAIRR